MAVAASVGAERIIDRLQQVAADKLEAKKAAKETDKAAAATKADAADKPDEAAAPKAAATKREATANGKSKAKAGAKATAAKPKAAAQCKPKAAAKKKTNPKAKPEVVAKPKAEQLADKRKRDGDGAAAEASAYLAPPCSMQLFIVLYHAIAGRQLLNSLKRLCR